MALISRCVFMSGFAFPLGAHPYLFIGGCAAIGVKF